MFQYDRPLNDYRVRMTGYDWKVILQHLHLINFDGQLINSILTYLDRHSCINGDKAEEAAIGDKALLLSLS